MGQVAGRGAGRAQVGRGSSAGWVRVAGHGAQTRFVSIFFEDVPGAGRVRYTPLLPLLPPESGGLRPIIRSRPTPLTLIYKVPFSV